MLVRITTEDSAIDAQRDQRVCRVIRRGLVTRRATSSSTSIAGTNRRLVKSTSLGSSA